MNAKKNTLFILLLGLFYVSACNFPGLTSPGEEGTPAATLTLVPTASVVQATSSPTLISPTESPVPALEPTPMADVGTTISIDNVKQLSIQAQIQSGFEKAIAALDLSSDGRYLAFSQWWDPENILRVWDLQEERLIQSLTFHTRDVMDIAFSADASMLASISQDGIVSLWEVGSWELADSISTFPRGAASLAFSPDGNLLAIGGYRNQLGVWRLADGKQLHHYNGTGPHTIHKVVFTSDGSAYYADTGYADVTAWSTADGELLRSFKGEACIGGYDLSSDETKLAYSSSCSAAHEPHDPLVTIAVRDVASGEALVYGAMKETSTRVFYTADDSLILTNSAATVRFWNAADGALFYQLPQAGRYIDFLLSIDGSLLIVGDADGDIMVYGVGS